MIEYNLKVSGGFCDEVQAAAYDLVQVLRKNRCKDVKLIVDEYCVKFVIQKNLIEYALEEKPIETASTSAATPTASPSAATSLPIPASYR